MGRYPPRDRASEGRWLPRDRAPAFTVGTVLRSVFPVGKSEREARTPRQRATAAVVALTQQLLPSATMALRLPPIRRLVIGFDVLIREALFGDTAAA